MFLSFCTILRERQQIKLKQIALGLCLFYYVII